MPSSVEAIANRMLLRWEKRRLARAARDRAQHAHQQLPLITVSGQHVGGCVQHVAQMVANRLAFDLVDKKLIELIANSAHVQQRVVRSLDEHVADAITRYIISEFENGGMSESVYLEHLSRTLLTIGQHGRAVIIGHGAQYILDAASTLRVRLIAPIDARVSRLAGQRDISRRAARAQVLADDADRAAFCRRYFDRDVSDPHGYDLVLDCETVPAELCAELIERAFRARFGDPEPEHDGDETYMR